MRVRFLPAITIVSAVAVLNALLSSCSIYSDAHYGYIDKKGRFVIATQFDRAREFSEGLAAVGFKKNADQVKNEIATGKFVSEFKWGYVNTTGKLVIPPQFDQARSFHNDRACVCIGPKLGYIDRLGQLIVPCKYELFQSGSYPGDDQRSDFSEGFAVVYTGGKNKDVNGRMIDGKMGYIDASGHFLTDPLFDGAQPFAEGLAAVAIKAPEGTIKWGYLDHQGKFKIELGTRYEYAQSFSCGLAQVSQPIARTTDRNFSYIDKSGRVAIGPQRWSFAGPFSEGLANVSASKLDNKAKHSWQSGFIDQKGKLAIPLQDRHFGAFSDGMATSNPGDLTDALVPRWGFIDKTGTIVVPEHYAGGEWYEFHEGLAAVPSMWPRWGEWLNTSWGFIDKTGKTAIEPKFGLPNVYTEEGVGEFHEGLAAVRN